MGKPKEPKLKSSIKALFNFIPSGPKTITWACNQQIKTHSFREIDYTGFNSMYSCSSPSSSSSINADHCSLREETEQILPNHICSIQPSSASSSSSTVVREIYPVDMVLKGSISSKRFFFSPCTTNSIMEEANLVLKAKEEMGLAENTSVGDQWLETEEGGECLIKEVGFCKEIITTPMTSMNPYMDFKLSMEEMVQAHGLKEWSCLQELLNCYLQLNDRTNHKTIIWAFVDLLMNLISEENNSKSNGCDHNKERCFPFPLCLDA
ncbi:transcription repressor OFP13-like [Magnolia sinica]|uniref:transcription repressor OFP13-like n=1 Tax=Magnolia sinica TaxID=86752 RepID=UPI002659F865|nr:transcription repressor OFP13-like [Magnolia sinica]